MNVPFNSINMFTIDLNGTIYRAEEDMNLLDFLRDELQITSLKNGCSEGACGACTVLVDGRATRACLLTVAKVSSKKIMTVEGLSEREKEAYVRAFSEAGAVQCGFCIPGMILSAKALLDKSPDPEPREIREAIRGNLCRCTGYLRIEQAISLAAKMLRGEAQVKPSAHAGIGASLPRVDAAEKVLGTGEYVDDMHVEDMRYGAVLRAKYPRALVKNIDVSAARVYPGVEAVMTAEDVPGERYWGFITKDWPVLVAAGEETRYVGDALALVAAHSRKIAREALALIKVDYEEFEPVTAAAFALSQGAPKIHSTGNVLSTTRISRGNAVEAVAKSAHVVTHRYVTPHTEHAFLEPESSLAVPQGDGGITVYAGSQSVYEDRRGIASILGLPHEKVRVVGKLVGGAFGGKEDLSVQHHAALLAMRVGKAGEADPDAPGKYSGPSQTARHGNRDNDRLRRSGEINGCDRKDHSRHRRLCFPGRACAAEGLHACGRAVPCSQRGDYRLGCLYQQPAGRRFPGLWGSPGLFCM